MTTQTGTRIRLRPDIERLVAYDAGPQSAPGAFKLAGNENPFEPLPGVCAAISGVSFSRYPDASSTALREALAQRHDVAADGVHVSAGSVSIIFELLLALAGPGDEVVMSWRSFEAYPKAVAVAGATSVTVPNTPGGAHALHEMAAAVTESTRAVLVCSPNNPTGSVVRHDDFERFLAVVPPSVVVVLDEAYGEYVRDPEAVRSRELLTEHRNLVILKTFSKAYGLAGLRVGYAVGDPAIMNGLRTTAVPFAVSDIAQVGALASLEFEDELADRVDRIVSRRRAVVEALRLQGWSMPDPEGNFVWLSTGVFTDEASRLFRDRGMLVRAFPPEGIRITIAEQESLEPLIEAAADLRCLVTR